MLLLALALLAQQDIQVSAELDRDRVEVGDAVTYTVRAVVDRDAPVTVTLPAFDGLTLTSRTESREPLAAGGPTELYIVELRLRADQPGLWDVGPVRVEQGTGVGLAPAVELMVVSAMIGVPRAGPRVVGLIQQARPPRPGEVGLSLLVSADTVRVGEQVDVVTAAWFPREVLGRLRRPPAIRPPAIDGVYSAVQPSAAGAAASREVGGVWYDIYVAHQIIFPVREGTVTVPPAGLSFGMPTGRQYFGEEKNVQLSSEPRRLLVRSLPAGGSGPVASGVGFEYQLSPEPARVGDPIRVDLVLSGAGNVALWPAPVVAWPDGSRGYPEDVVDQIGQVGGIVTGSKRFRYLVIADSAGSLALPDVDYPYFDPQRNVWSEVVARSVVVPVQPAAPGARRRAPLPPLPREPLGVTRLSPAGRTALWFAAALAPLAVLLLALRRRRVPAPERSDGADGAIQLQALVRAVVPDADHRRHDRLAASLREAGLDAGLSRDAAKAYHRIATRRFDPSGVEAPEALEREAGRILGTWPRRLRRVSWVVAGLLLLGPAALRAQTTGPSTPRAWYDAGAQAYQAGLDARAAADWLVARRLAPRNREIGAAWTRVARLSRDLSSAGRVSPLTPAELALVAGLCWVVGWLVRLRRGWGRAGVVLVGTALVLAAATGLLSWWYARPLAVLNREASLRQAPHGLAVESGRAEELTVVEVIATRPGWRLVEAGAGVRGWVPGSVLAEVRRLDFAP